MKVLVTGATGFLGRLFCQRLLGEGHSVSAWARRPERANQLLGPEVQLVAASGGDAALTAAVTEAQAVVNLAGESLAGRRWTRRRRRAIENSRVDLTARLVQAMRRAPRRARTLISASAVGIYGDRSDEQLTEHSPAGRGYLAALTARWEAAALDARHDGVRVVLPRFGVALGLGGGALARLLPFFQAGLGGPLGAGDQFMPWIHVDDLLDILMQALNDGRVEGAVNVVAPAPLRNADFAQALARSVGRRARLRVPRAALRLALGEAADLVLASQRVVPARLQTLGYPFRYPDVDSALGDLNDLLSSVQIERTDQIPADSASETYWAARRPRYRLSQSTWLPRPPEDVFPFFSAAANLGAITPAEMSFAIRTPQPIQMQAGTQIDYRITLGPAPMPWRTVIERWEPPVRFVDAQQRGPYHCWWHEHRLNAHDGGTTMDDDVHYAPPAGLLGAAAHRLFIAAKLRQIFAYRRQVIRQRFQDGARPHRRSETFGRLQQQPLRLEGATGPGQAA